MASVIGTIFFVLVFVIAIGTQAYVQGLQSQTGGAVLRAQQVVAQKSEESVAYVGKGQSVSALNSGGSAVYLDAIILRFANGTVYSPQITSSIPAGSSTRVSSVVPGTGCGTTSCTARFNAIVGGVAQGSVGLLTSLGNLFWYSPTGGPGSGGGQGYWTTSKQTTTGSTFVPIAGLAFSAPGASFYEVYLSLGYYQGSQTTPGVGFALSTSGSATLLACGGLTYPDVVQGCTQASGASIGPTIFAGNSLVAANYCLSSSSPCIYQGSVWVSFGSGGGTLQVEFDGSGSSAANVASGSSIYVVQLG